LNVIESCYDGEIVSSVFINNQIQSQHTTWSSLFTF